MSASVNIGDNFFSQSSVTVAVGGTVTWTWTGANMHSTTSTGNWDSGVMASGAFPRTFSSAGTFDYFCSVHPFMTGSVTVVSP